MLRLHLKTFEKLKKYLPNVQDEKEAPELAGGFSKIFFGYAKVKKNTDAKNDAKNLGLPIAIVHQNLSSSVEMEANIKASHEAFGFLRNIYKNKDDKTLKPAKSLSSPFIQRFLYVSEQKKISVRAYKDLLEFLNHLKKSRTDKIFIHGKRVQVNLKEMVSQLMLALYGLHKHGLVHRDIKPENFLVFIDTQGNICIELADLDTIASANDPSLTYIGTQDFIPENFIQQLSQNQTSNKDTRKKLNALYKTADKIYFDCYALGWVISLIAENFPIMSSKDYCSLQLLSDSLKHTNQLKKTVLASEFFGETPKQRKAYLYTIYSKFAQLKQMDFYDTYYQSKVTYYPEQEDAFWLLPKYLKDIYAIAENLENQIAFFNDNNASSKANDINIYLSIQRKTETLIQLIDHAFTFMSSLPIRERKLLNALKEDANTILRNIDFLLATPLKEIVADTIKNHRYSHYRFWGELNQRGTDLPQANLLLQEIDSYTTSKQILKRLSAYLQQEPNSKIQSFKILLHDTLKKNGFALSLTEHQEELRSSKEVKR